ncbi:MAG: tRNA-dihydrouridine synthase, partial [Phycisphaerae bacterium]|nr:tRNA-dihydrouridine synthase [Phycisphaerae bacterium]
IPVIGNGDVTQPQHVVDLMAASGCHGVMIGRGSLRTPWMFAQAWHLLQTGVVGAEPSLRQKVACILRHVELLERYHSREHTLHCMRSRISWYGKTMGHVKPLKEAVRTAADPADMRVALERWIETADVASDECAAASPTAEDPSRLAALPGVQSQTA